MGCWPSKTAQKDRGQPKDKGFKRPKWRCDETWDEDLLQRKCEEFWDTQPAYGGAKEVWDALKAVVEDLDNPNNQLIIESAGIIVHNKDLRTTYDERGFKYELPNYVLSEPTNLEKKSKVSEGSPPAAESGGQVELTSTAS